MQLQFSLNLYNGFVNVRIYGTIVSVSLTEENSNDTVKTPSPDPSEGSGGRKKHL